MSFYDDVYKEAEHDYDPREFDDDRPTRAELAEERESRFCPRCGVWCRYPKHEEHHDR